MQKPHRYMIDRVTSYADEATAYMRRRKAQRKPFARAYHPDGRGTQINADSEAGERVYEEAGRLVDLAGPD